MTHFLSIKHVLSVAALRGKKEICKESQAGTRKHICSLRFSAALFTVANMWKQHKCPWLDGWINQMGSIHTVEHYSVQKRREALTQATMWTDLEHLMLSEMN